MKRLSGHSLIGIVGKLYSAFENTVFLDKTSVRIRVFEPTSEVAVPIAIIYTFVSGLFPLVKLYFKIKLAFTNPNEEEENDKVVYDSSNMPMTPGSGMGSSCKKPKLPPGVKLPPAPRARIRTTSEYSVHESDFDVKITYSPYAQLKINLSLCHYVPRFFAWNISFASCLVIGACGYYKMSVEKENAWLNARIKASKIARDTPLGDGLENPVFGNFIEYLVVTESDHVYKCGTAPMLGIVVGMVDLIVCIFAWLSVENNSKTNISTLMMGGSGRPKKFSESSIELQQF